MVEFPYNHPDFTFRTEKGIHSKSYVHLSLIKWIFWYDNIFLKRLHSLFKFIGNMSWIKAVPVYHFKVFRRQMNENLWDKFFSRHCNESFLFIVSKVIEKESNFIIINFSNLVFSNRRTGKISSEISDNTLCAVDVTVTDIKEESFVFPVKFGNSVQGFFLILLSWYSPFWIILRTWYFHWPAIVSTLKCLIFLKSKFLVNPPKETMAWICGFHLRSLPKVCIIEIRP